MPSRSLLLLGWTGIILPSAFALWGALVARRLWWRWTGVFACASFALGLAGVGAYDVARYDPGERGWILMVAATPVGLVTVLAAARARDGLGVPLGFTGFLSGFWFLALAILSFGESMRI